MLTGGAFTRRSTLTFYDEQARSSSEVRVTQSFYGYDTAANEIYASTEIDGAVPNVNQDAQIIFKDYRQEFSLESPGTPRI